MSAKHIGRVGALAMAMGVGAATFQSGSMPNAPLAPAPEPDRTTRQLQWVPMSAHAIWAPPTAAGQPTLSHAGAPATPPLGGATASRDDVPTWPWLVDSEPALGVPGLSVPFLQRSSRAADGAGEGPAAENALRFATNRAVASINVPAVNTVPVGHFDVGELNALLNPLFDVAGMIPLLNVFIGNGIDGTAANPNGGAAGLFAGNGGDGFSRTIAGTGRGGIGGAAGLFIGNGGRGGAGAPGFNGAQPS
ncbi:MAG: Uncharacterized protein K0R01_3558, partial [Mycobacterium sp.]|nr:Uncharacterized protein [Mycobacterium sp.]